MEQGQERTTKKRQTYHRFLPPKIVIKKWLNSAVKKISPPVGQTLGSSHFEETPLSFGGDFAVYKFHRLQNVFKILFHKKVCKIICAKRKKTKFKIIFFQTGIWTNWTCTEMYSASTRIWRAWHCGTTAYHGSSPTMMISTVMATSLMMMTPPTVIMTSQLMCPNCNSMCI